MKLQRFEEGSMRFYARNELEFNKGKFFVSVTTALDVATPQQLINWYKYTSGYDIKKKMTMAAEFGTRLHDLVEASWENPNVEVPADLSDAYGHWLKLKKKHDIKCINAEETIYHPELGYSGTLDIDGTFEGKRCIMDLKTGFYSIKTGWQLAAYREAKALQHPDEEFGMVGLQIHREGKKNQAYTYEHYDFCFQRFKDCMGIFVGLNYNKLAKMKWFFLDKYKGC